MGRKRAPLTASPRQQVNLRIVLALAAGKKCQSFAVRRPARARFATSATCQLDGCAAGDRDAPDVADALVLLPVRRVLDERHLASVRRQLRIGERRDVQQVQEGHRARRIRLGAADNEGGKGHQG